MTGPPARTETVGPARLERRLRLAAVLVVLGLAVEAVSFAALHAAAFFAFLVPGALLVAAGIALYLWSIVSSPRGPEAPPGASSS